MKVAFIATGPNYLSEDSRFPPIGIGYMIAVLEQNKHQCHFLDLNYDTVDSLKDFSPQIVGISVMSSSFREALRISKKIKTMFPVKIIFGGPHVDIVLGEVLNEQEVDFAVYGEGENTITDLISILENDSLDELSSIQGLIYRDEQNIIVNPPRAWIESLDDLPFPDYSHFVKYPYTRYPLLTNRGCPFSCVYCAIGKIWGRKVRSRSAQNIISEMEYLILNWGKRPFVTLDDTFNVNVQRTKEFCRLILEKKLDVDWSCWSFRADNIDEELAQLLARAGCRSVSIGIESSSPQILKNIKKGETIEDINRGIRILRKADIEIHGNFMIGNPGDTLQTVNKSIFYALKKGLMDFDFYLALPYPKTELWNYIEREGEFITKDYISYNHMTCVPVFKTEEFPISDRKKAFYFAGRAKKVNRLYRKITKKRSLSCTLQVLSRLLKSTLMDLLDKR